MVVLVLVVILVLVVVLVVGWVTSDRVVVVGWLANRPPKGQSTESESRVALVAEWCQWHMCMVRAVRQSGRSTAPVLAASDGGSSRPNWREIARHWRGAPVVAAVQTR